ncbi:MAG: 2'-deoxycytidine 5'-triphosphate deaminase [Rhodomicrobium sp.]
MSFHGILPSQAIGSLIETGAISAAKPILPGQVQPASLDLRLGTRAFRLRASFMPGPVATTAEQIERFVLHTIDLSHGAVLETGCVYLAEIEEHLALPPGVRGVANPKSSTGRLDVFTRMIADHAPGFDQTTAGYNGRLYLEICPQTFPILVRPGSRLSQIRFRGTEAREAPAAESHPREAVLSVDLSGGGPYPLIGYRAKRHTAVIDVDRAGAYDVEEFWDPLLVTPQKLLILDPDEFYILASKETVSVPPAYAAEMEPFNALMGEFRVHYAGFFDPGFGMAAAGGEGSRAVLEVRSHKVPFILEDGQVIGRLIYEPLTALPAQLYGQDIGSHYQAQALKLSKHFRPSSP